MIRNQHSQLKRKIMFTLSFFCPPRCRRKRSPLGGKVYQIIRNRKEETTASRSLGVFRTVTGLCYLSQDVTMAHVQQMGTEFIRIEYRLVSQRFLFLSFLSHHSRGVFVGLSILAIFIIIISLLIVLQRYIPMKNYKHTTLYNIIVQTIETNVIEINTMSKYVQTYIQQHPKIQQTTTTTTKT